MDIEYQSRRGKDRDRSDPSRPMSREDIPTIEEQLESAEEILKEISREIEFIRRQEFIMRDKSGMSYVIIAVRWR